MQAIVVLAIAAVAFGQIVPNEYINTFKSEVSSATIKAHMDQVRASGSEIMFEYDFGGFRGYAVRVPMTASTQSLSFMSAAEIKLSEPNMVASINIPVQHRPSIHVRPVVPKINRTKAGADCTVQREATWGLVRTAQQELNIDGLYPYDSTQDGQGVTAYIIDTGIYTENVDFEDRAEWGYDAVENPSPGTDQNGHGTHCAGTVGGKDFGIAKSTKLVSVRVLNAGGSGSWAGVIAGIQWAAREATGQKAVASMSLGGGRNVQVNDAVKAAVATGLTVVVAAGNSAADACNFSPASEPTAITVMCSDSSDAFCYFSNYGSCSHVIAPGMGVTSAWIGSPYAQNTISGTSMSAPHVAGVVSKYLSAQSSIPTPAQVKSFITSTASVGYVTGVPSGGSTPNALLYSPCA